MRLPSSILLGLVASFGGVCGALGAPQWQQYRGNEDRLFPGGADLVNGTSIAWTFETDGFVYGAPCITEQGVAIASSWDGYLYAIAPDGSQLWKSKVGGLLVNVWSSPALRGDGKEVYVGGENSLWCFDTATGELLWQYETGGVVLASPIVDDEAGVVYIGSLDRFFYALGLDDGQVRWSYAVKAGIYGVAELDKRTNSIVVADMGETVYALDARSGNLRWDRSFGAPIPSSPCLSQDGTSVFVAPLDGNMHSVALSDGALQWSTPVGAVDGSSPMLLMDGTVLIGAMDGVLSALDPSDGSPRWTFQADSALQSAFAISRTTGAVLFSSMGTIGGGVPTAKLYAVDGRDGTELWNTPLGGTSFSSPAIAYLENEDRSLVYLGSNDNSLYAFEGI